MHLPAQVSFEEANALERYRVRTSSIFRLHCEYFLPHMLKILPGIMSGVPVDFVCAWSKVSWLYIEAYNEGLLDYLTVSRPQREEDATLFHRLGRLRDAGKGARED